MRHMGRFTLLFILTTLFLVVPTRRVYACTCPPQDPDSQVYVQSSLEHASAVFSGRVVKLQKLNFSELSQQWVVEVAFEVYKIWKGPSYKNFIIQTSPCGYPFLFNQEYLVFAYGDTGILYGDTYCSPTTELNNAQRYIQFLGDGKPPTLSNPNVTETDLTQPPGTIDMSPPFNQNTVLVYLIAGVCSTMIILVFGTIVWFIKTGKPK